MYSAETGCTIDGIIQVTRTGDNSREMKKTSELTKKQQKIIAAAAGLIAVAVIAFICIYIGKPLISFIGEPERFRAWVEQHGVLGRLVYMGIVVLQVVVAIIPGEPLEIAGGYAFGAVEGTILYLGAALLGSLCVFFLVRRFGIRFLEIFFSAEKIQSLKILKNNRKRSVLFFIIFLIPGTPKDLLCFYAGLTDMKLSTFLIINTIGRLPALISSTIGGNALGMESYTAAIVVFAVTLLISLIGYLIYTRMFQNKEE